MRKGVIGLALLAALTLLLPGRARAVSAASWILMNPDTGDVLWESDADTPRNIASVTKLVTALVVTRYCDPEETVTVADAAAGVEGSSIDLEAGERYTVRTLLYGLLLESGNDAAEALAIHVSGSDEAFSLEMNAVAAELGSSGSSFRNPHGLTQEGHYSTARDLARIMAAVLEDPLLSEILAARSYSGEGKTFLNHNRLLDLYEYTTGGKTGYTEAAGRTLVTSAEKDGIRLICVTLDDSDDWEDHAALYEAGFSRYRIVEVIPAGAVWEVPVISGTRDTARVAAQTLSVALLDDQSVSAQACLPGFVYAGVEAGEDAGYLSIAVDGRERTQIPLRFAETVEQDPACRAGESAVRIRWMKILLSEFWAGIFGS